MAGDWIKMRGNLWDDPRVSKLCDLTGLGEACVIGGLYWLWATADQHSEDGLMQGLTARSIDRKTGLQGFAKSLSDIGWILEEQEGVRIVRFEEHNGSSAKKRCQAVKRVLKHRAVHADETQNDEVVNAPSVNTPLTREEKRREEINKPKGLLTKRERFNPVAYLVEQGVSEEVANDWVALRKQLKASPTETAIEGIAKEAAKANFSLQAALTECCSRGWRGFKADWVNKPINGKPVNGKSAAFNSYTTIFPQQETSDARIIDVTPRLG